MKKINIYNINQYTKTGKLKKNTVPEMGLSIAGGDTKVDNIYIARTLKERGYHTFSKPYMFTHIDALNSNQEKVLIHECVIINGNEFITSPSSLYELLTI